MPDFKPAGDLERSVVDWSKGLWKRSTNGFEVPPGYLGELIGWEVDPGGYLAPRPGGKAGPNAGAGITPKTYGIGAINGTSYLGFTRTGGVSPFSIAVYPDILSGPGAALDTQLLAAGIPLPGAIPNARGNGGVLWGHELLAQTRYITNALAVGASAGSSPQNIYAIAFHKDRYFIASAKDSAGVAHVARLYYSEIGGFNLAAAWPGNSIDIYAEDGAPIVALASSDDGLYIAKTSGVWFLSGNSAQTFSVNKLVVPGAAMGASSTSNPQALIETPYGVILISRYTVAILNSGGEPDYIGLPVDNALSDNVDTAVQAAFFDNALYLAVKQTELWRFDFRTATWSQVHNTLTQTSMFALPGDQGAHGGATSSFLPGILLGAGQTVANTPHVNYLLASDVSNRIPDASGVQATTPYSLLAKFAPGQSSRRCTIRHVDILGRQGTTPSQFTLTTTTDGNNAAAGVNVTPAAITNANGVFRARFNIAITGYEHTLKLAVAPAAAGVAPWLHEMAILWEMEGAEEGSS